MEQDQDPTSIPISVPISVPPPTSIPPPVTALVSNQTLSAILLTPDEQLIHAIYQAGIQGYFDARRAGITGDCLFPEAKPVWELMEELAKLNRLPSLTEVHLKTGIQITEISVDPIDIGLITEKIVKRELTSQLHKSLTPLYKGDTFGQDPFETRDKLFDIYQKTAWGLGSPLSINSRDAVEKFKTAYSRAASADGGLLGLSSPWPTPDSASLGLQPGELTVVFAKRKIGKTIAGETLVHDPVTGQERTIKNLVETGDGQVLSWEKNQPLLVKAPSDYLDCGVKECLKITWKSGRSVVAAKTHPFRTPTGWVEADKLQIGHHVASASVLPEPTTTSQMAKEHIRFLALMIAEDGTTQTTPTFTSGVQDLVDDLRDAISTLGWTCELRARSTAKQYSIASDCENESISLLREHGLVGTKSIDKVIPPVIFSLPNEQLALFIGRLFSGDGSVEKKKNYRMVSYSTGSKKMAEQLQHLLLRFGIQASINVKPRTLRSTGEIRDYYELFFRKETIERFKEHVGPHVIGPKKAELDKVQLQGKSRVGWLHTDELKTQICAEMDARPELLPAVGGMLGYTCQFMKSHLFDSRAKRINKRGFEAFCDVYDSPLAWVLDENLWWDEIVSIEAAGEHHCYDLTVPGTSCYIANDFIVHNSWCVIVWALHMWRNDLKPGEKILFVTMEMTELQIMRRMACVDLRLPWDDLRKGKLTMHQKKALDDWCDQRIADEQDDTKPNIVFATSKECRTAKDIGALVAEHQPVCVVVDSFYILGRGDGKSIYEKVLGNVEALKLDVALQHNVPVLASTQLKGTVDKETLSADSDDAMGAKAIGDYADVTRGLFADEELWAGQKRYWRGMEAREFVAKDVEINFNFDTMDFSEIREILDDDEKTAEAKSGKKSGVRRTMPSDDEIERSANRLDVDDEDEGALSI